MGFRIFHISFPLLENDIVDHRMETEPLTLLDAVHLLGYTQGPSEADVEAVRACIAGGEMCTWPGIVRPVMGDNLTSTEVAGSADKETLPG